MFLNMYAKNVSDISLLLKYHPVLTEDSPMTALPLSTRVKSLPSTQVILLPFLPQVPLAISAFMIPNTINANTKSKNLVFLIKKLFFVNTHFPFTLALVYSLSTQCVGIFLPSIAVLGKPM